jgi:uncharacterized membrane protein YphA (DoxX/SURF4 family)
MILLRIASRVLIAWLFLRNALDVVRNPGPRVTQASWLLDAAHSNVPLLPRDDVVLVRSNAIVQLVAASLLALGQQRAGSLALAASMVPTTLGGHAFWKHDDPTRRAQQQIHFDKNLAIIGGLLILALESPRRRRA